MAGIRICGFIIELWEYQLGLKLFFSVQLRRKWLAVIGIAFYAAFVFSGQIRERHMYIIAYGLTVALIFFMADIDWKRKTGKILLLLFVISCMESFCEIGIAALLERYGGTVLAEKWNYLGGSMATLGVLTVLKVVNNRKHWMEKENIIRLIRKWMVLLIILMTLEMILTAAGLNYTKRYISDNRFREFAGIFSSGAYFAICVLVVFFIYIKNVNEKLEQTAETERKLKEMQEKYYEAMLKREEETRKYRHDLKNHLICLDGLAREEHAEKTAVYVGSMLKQAAFVQQKFYDTGNKILDSLVNYYGAIIEPDAKLTVSGKIARDLELTDADLCTVFGNLLQNAAEGLTQVQNEEKYIRVQLEQGREYLRIKIENSASLIEITGEQFLNKFLKTTKRDKRNHGIGIRNVRDTLKRYSGTLEVKREPRKFIAEIILKNR
jgi:hypothetical protein